MSTSMDKKSSSHHALPATPISSTTATTRNVNSISNIPNPVLPPDYNDLVHSTISSRNDNSSNTAVGATIQSPVNNEHSAINTITNSESKQLQIDQTNSMGNNNPKQSTAHLLIDALNKTNNKLDQIPSTFNYNFHAPSIVSNHNNTVNVDNNEQTTNNYAESNPMHTESAITAHNSDIKTSSAVNTSGLGPNTTVAKRKNETEQDITAQGNESEFHDNTLEGNSGNKKSRPLVAGSGRNRPKPSIAHYFSSKNNSNNKYSELNKMTENNENTAPDPELAAGIKASLETYNNSTGLTYEILPEALNNMLHEQQLKAISPLGDGNCGIYSFSLGHEPNKKVNPMEYRNAMIAQIEKYITTPNDKLPTYFKDHYASKQTVKQGVNEFKQQFSKNYSFIDPAGIEALAHAYKRHVRLVVWHGQLTNESLISQLKATGARLDGNGNYYTTYELGPVTVIDRTKITIILYKKHYQIVVHKTQFDNIRKIASNNKLLNAKLNEENEFTTVAYNKKKSTAAHANTGRLSREGATSNKGPLVNSTESRESDTVPPLVPTAPSNPSMAPTILATENTDNNNGPIERLDTRSQASIQKAKYIQQQQDLMVNLPNTSMFIEIHEYYKYESTYSRYDAFNILAKTYQRNQKLNSRELYRVIRPILVHILLNINPAELAKNRAYHPTLEKHFPIPTNPRTIDYFNMKLVYINMNTRACRIKVDYNNNHTLCEQAVKYVNQQLEGNKDKNKIANKIIAYTKPPKYVELKQGKIYPTKALQYYETDEKLQQEFKRLGFNGMIEYCREGLYLAGAYFIGSSKDFAVLNKLARNRPEDTQIQQFEINLLNNAGLCNICHLTQHRAANCPYKGQEIISCKKCGRVGHISSNCKSVKYKTCCRECENKGRKLFDTHQINKCPYLYRKEVAVNVDRTYKQIQKIELQSKIEFPTLNEADGNHNMDTTNSDTNNTLPQIKADYKRKLPIILRKPLSAHNYLNYKPSIQPVNKQGANPFSDSVDSETVKENQLRSSVALNGPQKTKQTSPSQAGPGQAWATMVKHGPSTSNYTHNHTSAASLKVNEINKLKEEVNTLKETISELKEMLSLMMQGTMPPTNTSKDILQNNETVAMPLQGSQPLNRADIEQLQSQQDRYFQSDNILEEGRDPMVESLAQAINNRRSRQQEQLCSLMQGVIPLDDLATVNNFNPAAENAAATTVSTRPSTAVPGTMEVVATKLLPNHSTVCPYAGYIVSTKMKVGNLPCSTIVQLSRGSNSNYAHLIGLPNTIGPTINHSTTPNCELYQANPLPVEYGRERCQVNVPANLISVRTITDISPGTILTIDYSKSYWKAHEVSCTICFCKNYDKDGDPLIYCSGIVHNAPCSIAIHYECSQLDYIPSSTGPYYCPLCIKRIYKERKAFENYEDYNEYTDDSECQRSSYWVDPSDALGNTH